MVSDVNNLHTYTPGEKKEEGGGVGTSRKAGGRTGGRKSPTLPTIPATPDTAASPPPPVGGPPPPPPPQVPPVPEYELGIDGGGMFLSQMNT